MKIYKILFWACAISIISVSSIPSLSIPINDRFSPDKMAHFLEYSIFAFLFYKYRSSENVSLDRIINQLWLILLFIPILDELHQKLIPGRSCSIYDVIADSLGFLTIIIFLYLKKRKTLHVETI